MFYLSNFKYLFVVLIFELCTAQDMKSAWLSRKFSSIRLLGLFEDVSNLSNLSNSTDFAVHCLAMFKAAVFLTQQYNITFEGQYLGWQAVQTRGDVIDSLSGSCQAVSNENIIGIVGPSYSREARIVAAFAHKIGIPAISFSATDPDLTDRNSYPAFFRIVPPDDIAAVSIAQLFIKFNWTSCIIIYQNDAYGTGGNNAITKAFDEYGLQVPVTLTFDIVRQYIQGDLQATLLESPARIVILWTQSSYATLILKSALELGVVGPQFTWILSSTVSLKSFNSTFAPNLIGILTIEPTVGDTLGKPINNTLLNAAYNIWQQYEPSTFPGPTKVNNYALFTFDATWALIQSLQKLCSTNISNSYSCVSFISSTFCYDSRFQNGDSFYDQIIKTSFLGVSGPIEFSKNVTNRIAGAYYLIRNVQLASNDLNYVPVLEWSASNSWTTLRDPNVIVWPGNTLERPNGRPKLANVTLRIGVTISIPFTFLSSNIDEYGQSTTTIIGYAPDLINMLQDRMGFIPIIMLASQNQTYAGLVKAVAQGVYDIVVADTTITSVRREMAGFSTAIFDNSLRIIMRKKAPPAVDLIAYLRPFSFTLWMMLFVTMIFAAFLICLIERWENQILHNRSIVSSMTMSFWYSIGTIMGYGADFQVATAAGRLLTVGLYLLSLVLVATYTANLASDLTISKSNFIISGIDDIKNGRIPFNRIGVRVGTAGEGYYLREISAGVRNFYPLSSRQHMYDALLNNLIDASFMDSGTAEYVTNNVYCNLTLIGADFDKSSLAIVTPKKWLYEQDLDINILALREAGVLEALKRKWFQASTCDSNPDESSGMAMETMSGLFLTFAVISILSLLLFLWTKRWAMKNYLFKLAGRSSRLKQKGTTMTKCTPELPKISQRFQPASLDRMLF